MSEPTGAPAPPSTHWGLTIALSVALGFLGSNAFAHAAGFPDPAFAQHGDDAAIAVFLRVLSAIIVFFVTMGVTRLLIGLARSGIAALRTVAKPGLPVVLTLIICGTACMLAAVGFPLFFAKVSPIPSVQAAEGIASVTFRTQLPFTATLAAIFAFLAGVVLVAIGLWGGLKSGASQPAQATSSPPPPAPQRA